MFLGKKCKYCAVFFPVFFFFALDAKCKAIMHGARIFWCMEQISDNQILGIEISIERVTQSSLSPDFAINDRLQHLVICSESLGNVLHFSLPVSPCILPSFFIHKKKSIVHLISLKTIIDIVSYLIFFLFFFLVFFSSVAIHILMTG